MENTTNKITCSLCGRDGASFYTSKNSFDLYKCLNCGLIFISPIPESIGVYDDSYFSGAEKGFGYVDYDADKEPMIPTFNKYLDILDGMGVKGGSLLDIGAATGFFMNIAKKRGFVVTGVEFSDFAAEKGRKLGLNLITGDLISQKFSDECFDVITMFDVIEHVPNPKEIISEVKRILKKGGVVIINTPDAESVWAKVLGRHWQLIMPPEHINYFSPRNLGNYMMENGFKVILSTKIGKKFTLQYVIKMLYKWSGLRIFLTKANSTGFLSKTYIPINLRDNFFMIVKKHENI